MTIDHVGTLDEAIAEALVATHHGSTPAVVRWLQLHRRGVIDQNLVVILQYGLGYLVRAFRKKKDPSGKEAISIAQLCLDLGIPLTDLDTEISVPQDMNNIVYGPSAWVELCDDATAEDVEKHFIFLEETARANVTQAGHYRTLHQAMVRKGGGRTDIPMRDLRKMGHRRN